MLLPSFFSIFLLLSAVYGRQIPFSKPQDASASRYAAHSLSRILPSQGALSEVVQHLQSHDIDIWRATHDAVDFVSTPASPLLLSDYNVSVIVDDLSAAIQSTFLPLDSLETDIHSRYHSYDALQAIHTMLAADFPNHLFKLDLGPSAQDRPIEALKLSTGLNPSTGRPKPQLLFVAGQHAREWISTSTALFLAHTMVTELADPEIYDPRQELLDAVNAFDFVFLPSINPDGYQYSWEHDRLWRKSRQPTSEPGCVGLDLNRNWDFNFRSPQRPNPCLDTWPGAQPFEAPETRAVRDYVLNAANHVVAFIDLHSFGQMVLIPWSSDCSQVVKDYEDLTEAGLGAAKRAQFLHGKSFEVGQSCEVNYPSSGESTDWSYGAANIKWSFAVQLRDLGAHGFLMPPQQIRATGEETMELVLSLASFIKTKLKA